MTFEMQQLRLCHWSAMGSTQPHHAARPKAVCSVHAGSHDPGYFEHILGLMHSTSLTPSGQSLATTEDPADLLWELPCLHRLLAMNQRKMTS